ncbi:MAG: transketolase C-terminal domain-containing protein [Spirochaetia bacterium]
MSAKTVKTHTAKREMQSTRKAAGKAILELAQEGRDVVALAADTAKSMYTTLLAEEYPDRAVDVGIAEQNMVMMAAGLASTGKTAFAASYSVFTSMRCSEQLRTFAAYPRLNVNVIAGIGGYSGGIEGVTHLATEDLGIMRCIAGMTVLAPADAAATRKAVKAAAELSGPVYIRVGRDDSPVLFDESYPFEVGVPILHKEGGDITLVSTGLATAYVFEAAELLAKEGISAELIEVHTLKPILQQEIIADSIAKTGKVLTIEEHNIVGGLATVVAELMEGKGVFEFGKIGLPDIFGESGTPEELRRKYKVEPEAIAEEARTLL